MVLSLFLLSTRQEDGWFAVIIYLHTVLLIIVGLVSQGNWRQQRGPFHADAVDEAIAIG